MAGTGSAGLAPGQGSRWEQAAADMCHNKRAQVSLAREAVTQGAAPNNCINSCPQPSIPICHTPGHGSQPCSLHRTLSIGGQGRTTKQFLSYTNAVTAHTVQKAAGIYSPVMRCSAIKNKSFSIARNLSKIPFEKLLKQSLASLWIPSAGCWLQWHTLGNHLPREGLTQTGSARLTPGTEHITLRILERCTSTRARQAVPCLWLCTAPAPAQDSAHR